MRSARHGNSAPEQVGRGSTPEPVALMGALLVDHEADYLRHARSEGFDNRLTGDLRNHGVRLALHIADRGTGMTADEEAVFRKQFEGRLSKAQQDQLLGWFKKNVIGQ